LRFLLSQLKAHTLIKILDEAADLSWPEDTEAFKEGKMVLPGDNVEMECSLLHRIALEPGQRFNVREGGRTVATGLVTRIID
jgi:elongation factor Tu